jgi:hypothetical protein
MGGDERWVENKDAGSPRLSARALCGPGWTIRRASGPRHGAKSHLRIGNTRIERASMLGVQPMNSGQFNALNFLDSNLSSPFQPPVS